MDTLLRFVLSCIFLYAVVSRVLYRRKRDKAVADTEAKALDIKNTLLNKYLQIAETINSDFILHSRNVSLDRENRNLYASFVFLTPDGVSFCTEADTGNTVTIPYKNIRCIDYACGSTCSPVTEPALFMSKLMCIDLEVLNSGKRLEVVSFNFTIRPNDPEFIFNQQSLQNGNFFAELHKHTNFSMEDVAKILE